MNTKSRRHGAILFITGFLIALLIIPQQGYAAIPDEDRLGSVDTYVEEQMDASRIPGVALSIVQDGEIIHARGFGETSGAGDEVTPDTLFGIGSTGKSITALGIMQLAEAGEMELDAPVVDYIPWFTLADSDATSRLTVRHLLNMTSGIPATAGGEAFRSTESMTPEAAIRTLQTAEFAHEPGSSFEYVNANYVILGYLIEVVSGQPYADYVREHIFEPLEMDNTYTDLELSREAGFAAGHRYWFGWPVAHEMDELPALVPAGYIISTAVDLSNYLAMYLNEGTFNGREILSPAGIEEMHRGVVEATLGPWADGASAQYAMGWYEGGPWSDGSMMFHPGSEPTFTAMLILDRENDLGIVTLMNSATEMPLPGAAGALRVLPSGVASILTGDEPATTSLSRFYLTFTLVVAVVIAIQIVSLVRLVRQSMTNGDASLAGWNQRSWARKFVPLVWEFGLPLLVLMTPGVLGMSWRSVFLWLPDLGVVLLAVATLWLVTGIVRVTALVRSRRRRYQEISEPEVSTREHAGHASAT
jgi:CubicO group peptidase (beta-lactamase class C family)